MGITCTIDKKTGDLILRADNTTRLDIADALKQGRASYAAIMADLLEPYSTNGSFTPFDAGEGRPFVGLTSAPCIAESMDFADDGEPSIVGRFWYFADYQTRSELEELRNRGRVVFTLAK